MGLDLVTVWGLILAFGLMVYVLLDGFHLGVGLLGFTVHSPQQRGNLVASLAPVCGANVAWLILCSIGLMVAFPLAAALLLDALYIPVLIMLAALGLRNLAFHGLLKTSQAYSHSWQLLFSASALIATFSQGAMIGAVLQGVSIEQQTYIGGAWDWLTWFSVLTGVCLMLTYALLGATWLLATNKDQGFSEQMRHYSHHLLVWLGYAVMSLQLVIPFLTPELRQRWLGLPNFFYMGFVPMLGLMAFVWAYYVIRFSKWRVWPLGIVLMFLGTVYFMLITCLWPAIIAPDITLHRAAAAESSLMLYLWGAVILVSALSGYLYWAYQAFYVQGRRVSRYHS
ncbi:Cytochrome bd-II ubiquinol oxidase subunit 2 [Marinomonas aquimarina]|uniref:Cytochrome bd-II ubiquinol oxidase subunit 2 n=1 Tax=Marinomonas aquimarina TaxID=295068 RepID=A0A1A8TIR8_9GAMM|nr:cytochrome d ubiquinol oxidase subunit II [Marinomonas aquimarina]SBS33278.1 Cytochrome bd-II ubiquinol oxidase subunit 2 [Marinomonas aquimarina]